MLLHSYFAIRQAPLCGGVLASHCGGVLASSYYTNISLVIIFNK